VCRLQSLSAIHLRLKAHVSVTMFAEGAYVWTGMQSPACAALPVTATSDHDDTRDVPDARDAGYSMQTGNNNCTMDLCILLSKEADQMESNDKEWHLRPLEIQLPAQLLHLLPGSPTNFLQLLQLLLQSFYTLPLLLRAVLLLELLLQRRYLLTLLLSHLCQFGCVGQ